MSVLSVQCARLRSWAMQFDERADIDALAPLLASDLREAADTIESLRNRLQDAELGSGTCEVSYEQDGIPRCSNCQNVLYDEYKDGIKNYCDECGAKVVER